MKANYLCPNCRTCLNIGDQIIISAKNEEGKKGILLLSIFLGDYEIKKHSSFDLEENEKLDMYCPCCFESLRNPMVHDNIFKILMQDEEDQEHEILFSGIYGERCTYQIRDKKVSTFGQDAGKYLNYTNLINMS
ncbi:hypothetical protein BZG02_18595 [Labilibaculum filiforme]|uniref:Uncharacterized protein n=1 Tax=Labilibaculum filiforme TaxID=1940526 RepID=A0A2N3HRC8_9BACT|nr:hypothetical protein [Labilibaculum filiforme]PKQ60600.1 hypothetical protein BZG02_18595 [Labilibaculum filiforme]